MADELRDDDVSARYGELRRPEPPRALDDAILAASRRAVGARPGGVDGGRRGSPTARWALPASVAAVLALSVMVTLHVQEERPDLEAPVPRAVPEAKREAPAPAVGAAAEAVPTPPEKPASLASPAPPTAPPRAAEPVARRDARADAERAAVASNTAARSAAAKREAERRSPGFASDPPTVATAPAVEGAAAAPARPASAEAPAAPAVPAMQSAAGASAAPPPPAPAAAPAARELRARGELSRDRGEPSRDDSRPAAKLADSAETPEKQLERIAVLRKDGRHAEADQLLKEFRARHPGYRIPDAMLEKVQPPR